MPGYVYRGTDFTIPPERTYTIGGARQAPKCGTRAGYVAHRKFKEDACRPCKDANQAYNVEYEERRTARLIKKGWTGDRCGTLAGYKAHQRHAHPMCEPCRKANSDYCKAYKASKQAAA